MAEDLKALLAEVRGCQACPGLPLGPKPILQMSSEARILIVGQAPGRITHAKGVPFDDPSGERLRQWMGIRREIFYDETKVACLPIGFCYPGTGKGGDLPPRTECAPLWRKRLLHHLRNVQLTLVIGQYAQNWHFRDVSQSLTDRVRQWDGSTVVPLPHPSPRNGVWLKANPWFADGLLPKLKAHVQVALS
jgi:uracil-DNA glycosylase